MRRVFVILLLWGSVSSASPFRDGTQAASEERWQEAINLFEQAVATGLNDSAVYFNLGNAYYHEGRYASALLNYYRALHREPRFAAAKNNAAMARERLGRKLGIVIDGYSPAPPSTNQLYLRVPQVIYALIALAGSLLLVYAFARGLIARQVRVAPSVLGVLLGTLGLLGTQATSNSIFPDAAIILSEKAIVRESPSGDSEILQYLYAGEVRAVLQRQGNWVSVPYTDGQGWLSLDAVGIID